MLEVKPISLCGPMTIGSGQDGLDLELFTWSAYEDRENYGYY